MKTILPFVAAALAIWSPTTATAQTVNWGSPMFSSIVDSAGVELDNTFVFELGAFANGFQPNAGNQASWFDNWRVFDTAGYNDSRDPDPIFGYYTGVASLEDNGTSTSPWAAGGFNFGGLEAYVWVRNSDDAVQGSEWFLARSALWEFPDPVPGCCDNDPPLDWSLSDLKNGSVTPLFGSQDGLDGAGVFTVDGVFSLQTFTVIPEPSSAILITGGLLALALRRRRND